jgi:hypothetical protein
MPLWTDYTPAQAINLDLRVDTTITGPVNENGEPCWWPWEPEQLPISPGNRGRFGCSYCGGIVVSGLPHPDHTPTP